MTKHTVNESADKIRLDTKIKRGSDVRDQDEVKVQIKGDDPEHAVEMLAKTLEALEHKGVASDLRSTQPDIKTQTMKIIVQDEQCIEIQDEYGQPIQIDESLEIERVI